MQQEFELCAETLQACEAAQAGGADRVELCAALNEGGVTPGPGFLREVIASVSLPVHVLLRPRSGNFVYTEAEFRMICGDLESALSAGATGVVLGLLTPDHQLDKARTADLITRARGKPVTVHRAFDQLANQAEALEQLIDLGCARVLTSGGKPTVSEGRDALASLATQARGRIRIAAGGGITLQNAAQFAAIPGLDLHASLRRKAAPSEGDPLWSVNDTDISAEDVRQVVNIIRGCLTPETR